MKFLSTLLLLISTSLSNNNIIGGHAKEHCVTRSTYLGCYENRNQDRALPYEMKGRDYKPKECELACASRGYLYFAREWMGQCFCSNSDDYDKHGTSRNCSCCGTNVGANKMCVYKLQPTSSSTENENVVGGQVGEQHDEIAPGCMDKFHDAPYLGCYEDRQKDRALSHKVMGRYHDAKTCHVECNKLGYRYFARQWRGQCFCGNEGYDKHGITYNCNCCGRSVGPNKMCVWQGDGDGNNVQGGGGQSGGSGGGGTGFEINW